MEVLFIITIYYLLLFQVPYLIVIAIYSLIKFLTRKIDSGASDFITGLLTVSFYTDILVVGGVIIALKIPFGILGLIIIPIIGLKYKINYLSNKGVEVNILEILTIVLPPFLAIAILWNLIIFLSSNF